MPLHARRGSNIQDQLLLATAYGGYQPATHGQLLKQGCWHLRWRSGQNNAIKRCMLRPAFIAIAITNADVIKLELPETSSCLVRQALDSLDAIDIGSQLRQNRGLITRASANLQDPLRCQPIEQQLRHARYRQRLRDGLTKTDW